MTEVRWTPQAADDLQAIYDFIERDSPHYAQVILEDILDVSMDISSLAARKPLKRFRKVLPVLATYLKIGVNKKRARFSDEFSNTPKTAAQADPCQQGN